jgi:hypothetical protein
MPSFYILALAVFASSAVAQTASSAAPESTDDPLLLPAEVTNCHTHAENEVFCFDNGAEWAITSENATEYDGEATLNECVPHGEGGEVM